MEWELLEGEGWGRHFTKTSLEPLHLLPNSYNWPAGSGACLVKGCNRRGPHKDLQGSTGVYKGVYTGVYGGLQGFTQGSTGNYRGLPRSAQGSTGVSRGIDKGVYTVDTMQGHTMEANSNSKVTSWSFYRVNFTCLGEEGEGKQGNILLWISHYSRRE